MPVFALAVAIVAALADPTSAVDLVLMGLPGLGTQLAVFAAWAIAALITICWLVRRGVHKSAT